MDAALKEAIEEFARQYRVDYPPEFVAGLERFLSEQGFSLENVVRYKTEQDLPK